MVEFARPRRFVMDSGSKGFQVRSTMTFESLDEHRTRIVEALEMKTSGFTRLMEPLIARQVPKQGRAVHERLKQVLESQASTRPG
jgi:hypothetical protein